MNIERKIVSTYDVSKEISRLRKEEKKVDEAYQLAKSALETYPNDKYVQGAMGWVLYERIKQEVYRKVNYRETEQKHSNIVTLLQQYSKLKALGKPDMLHSLILATVIKVENWKGLIPFAQWWNPQINFRAEDFKPNINPNDPKPAKFESTLFLSFHYALGQIFKSSVVNLLRPDQIEWIEAQLLSAVKKQPKDIWLHYYLARHALYINDYTKALNYFTFVLKQKANDFWVWDFVGDWYRTQKQPENAIPCYYHAIFIAHEEKQIINTRLELAECLAQLQRYEEASYQVLAAENFRHQMNWSIPNALQVLKHSPWFTAKATTAVLPTHADILKQANDIKRTLMGAQNIQSASSSKGQDTADKVRRFSGKVKRQPAQNFAFLDVKKEKVYIPPKLVSQFDLQEGNVVHCEAVPSTNKQDKPSWQVVRIIPNSQPQSNTIPAQPLAEVRVKPKLNENSLSAKLDQKPSHHICLVSNAPMSTIGVLIDPSNAVTSATLVCTDYTKPFAVHQQAILQERGIQTSICLLTDSEQITAIEAQLLALKQQYTNQTIAINITGGSKLMSLAAERVFNDADALLYYVNASDDTLVWLNDTEHSYVISDSITLNEYFIAMGYEQTGRSTFEPAQSHMSVLNFLAHNQHATLVAELLHLGRTQQNQSKAKLSIPLTDKPHLQPLAEALVGASLATIENESLILASNMVWKFLEGEWLEHYCYLCLKQQQRQDPTLQDIGIGIKLANSYLNYTQADTGNSQAVELELDVCYLINNALNIVECKTGKNFPGADAESAILKLHAHKTKLIGIKGKSILMSLYPLTPLNRAKAKELGVLLIEGWENISCTLDFKQF
jgi:tetratricopeptide (TPR) repeat protein